MNLVLLTCFKQVNLASNTNASTQCHLKRSAYLLTATHLVITRGEEDFVSWYLVRTVTLTIIMRADEALAISGPCSCGPLALM